MWRQCKRQPHSSLGRKTCKTPIIRLRGSPYKGVVVDFAKKGRAKLESRWDTCLFFERRAAKPRTQLPRCPNCLRVPARHACRLCRRSLLSMPQPRHRLVPCMSLSARRWLAHTQLLALAVALASEADRVGAVGAEDEEVEVAAVALEATGSP